MLLQLALMQNDALFGRLVGVILPLFHVLDGVLTDALEGLLCALDFTTDVLAFGAVGAKRFL